MFAVSRQTGTNSRVLQSTTNNQLFGYWAGYKRAFYVDNNPNQLTTALSDTQWDIMSHTRTAGSAYTFSWNGTSLFTGATSSGNNLTGLAINAGAFPENSSCQIAEIILYSAVLTLEQRQQIEGYLAWKWGLQGNLPVGHPFKSSPIAMRIFQPPDIGALALWLDAADGSTITTSGSEVVSWRDKSPNALSFTGVSGSRPTYTNAINGLPVVSSATGKRLSNASWRQNFTSSAIFIVMRPTHQLTEGQVMTITNYASGQLGFALLFAYSNQVNYYYYLNVFCAQTSSSGAFVLQSTLNNTGGFNPTNTPILMTTNIVPSTQFLRYNGTQIAPTLTDSRSFVASSGVTLFVAGANDNGSQAYDLGELIVTAGSLTVNQMRQIEGYLANKWGLTQNFPSTEPYYLKRALPSTPLFVPSQLSGLRLWLDAADRNELFSDSAGTTLVGPSGNVGMWRDKSGLGRNYTQSTSGIRPSLLNNTVTTTNNTGQFLSNATTLQATGIDLFFVGTPHSSTANRFRSLFRDNAASDLALLLPPTDSGSTLAYYNAGATRSFTGITLTGLARTLIYVSYSVARVPAAAINGTASLVIGPTALTTNSQFDFLGGRPDIFQPWGEMNEVILVSNTTTEIRQRVEGYLAWKWGLQNNLPTTHPYYKFRP
jgi:hypothetical protein